jgi:hypothetical protein
MWSTVHLQKMTHMPLQAKGVHCGVHASSWWCIQAISQFTADISPQLLLIQQVPYAVVANPSAHNHLV